MSVSEKVESLGSSPRSSEGIYKKASEKAASFFSSSAKPTATPSATSSAKSSSPSLFTGKPSASRIMNAPLKTVTEAISSVNEPPSFVKPSGGSFFRYLIIFCILGFLGVNFLLFLIKPADKGIKHLYDPILDIIKGGMKKMDKVTEKKPKTTPAVKKLEKVIDAKPVVNKIDKDKPTATPQAPAAPQAPTAPTKKFNKLPVIPEADDSTSTVQKPASKSGFCYIGEDRGFRSCIEVGEGETCMSGDIFPTDAICINPNLRE
jgi:hypothetical protein